MAIKNFYNKEEWLRIVRDTLINFGYPSDLILYVKAWLQLFDEHLHPLDAIKESEGIYPFAAYYESINQLKNK